ncbi:MAG: T9SS type A sorting domain-containing protein [Limnohabitans sp.]|nr:T9SS type A sorting domain-containing protein [Limnohabitans sp.]
MKTNVLKLLFCAYCIFSSSMLNAKSTSNVKNNLISVGKQQSSSAALVPGIVPIFHYYKNNGDHLFTKNYLPNPDPFRYAEVAFKAFNEEVAGTIPIYRYSNSHIEDNFFATTNDSSSGIFNGQSYTYEGVEFYAYNFQVSGTIPVYRYVYTDEAQSDKKKNFYTVNINTYGFEGNVSFAYAGIAFYVFPKSCYDVDCLPAINLSVSEITPNSVLLSWINQGTPSVIYVEYKSVGSSVWTAVNPAFSPLYISGLQEGTNYEWRVRSICDSNTVYSSVNHFTTSFAEIVIDPNDLNPTASGKNDKNSTTNVVENHSVKAFPNPTQGKVVIESKNCTIETITVIDFFEKTVLVKEINGKSTTFDISTFPKGIYYVKAKTTEGLKTVKVIRE